MLHDIDRLQEEYEDSYFRYMMSKYAQELGAEFQAENEELKASGDFEPSPEAIRKFDRTLSKAFRKRTIINAAKKTYTSMNRAAVFVVIAVFTFTISALAIEPIRVSVLNFLIGFEDEYASIRLDSSKGNNVIGDNVYVSWSGGYVPMYIPEGYQLASLTNTPDVKTMMFRNADEKMITYSENSANTVTNLDTENSETETVYVNGYPALLVEKGYDTPPGEERLVATSITWSDGERVFLIASQLDKQELLKVARNVMVVN